MNQPKTTSRRVDAATTDATQQTPSIVLLGNPNTGKSTLFNVLCGLRQKTGNYPGVTVERKTGQLEIEGRPFQLIDLPGTYSLAPESPDEMVSVNVLMGRPPAQLPPDLIVCVVDASNLERNLFLVSQLLDLHRPMVLALNMTDIAQQAGHEVDVVALADALGIPVVPIQARQQVGIEALKHQIAQTIGRPPARQHDPFDPKLAARLKRLQSASPSHNKPSRFVLTRMLFDSNGYMVDQLSDQLDGPTRTALQTGQQVMRDDGTLAVAESTARYDWIRQHLKDVVQQSQPDNASFSDRVDAVLTHPLWGLIIAAVAMLYLFQWVFWAAEPASAMIDWLTGGLASVVDSVFIWLTGAAEGALHSLLVNGLIAGVGGVLVFVPQIALLFFVLAILEDSGYLARAAFLTDRYLSRLGLSGITLIPLLSSFACAIPGIMATRVIRDPRERLITILIAPLMSCSARLPVYVLLIAAFVPAERWLGVDLRAITMLSMYLVGVVTAIAVAWLLKNTILKTGTSTFVMELPTYKFPSFRNVGLKIWEGAWSFVRDAGTVIVAATIIVWAAAWFPRDMSAVPQTLIAQQQELSASLDSLPAAEAEDTREQLAAVEAKIDGHLLRNSYLGRAGKWIEPVVRPLGWDWRIGSAALASFPAREVIVSTLGVLFGLGEDVSEESDSLKETIKNARWGGTDRPLFTLPVALSIMVFFALCAQCVSTLAVIKRETGSWHWPVFTFVYMTVLAYFGALMVFQVSSRLMV